MIGGLCLLNILYHMTDVVAIKAGRQQGAFADEGVSFGRNEIDGCNKLYLKLCIKKFSCAIFPPSPSALS